MRHENSTTASKHYSVRNCSFYDDSDFSNMLQGLLSEPVETQLRHHCESCDDCASRLKEIEWILDEDENRELLKRALAIMDSIDTHT